MRLRDRVDDRKTEPDTAPGACARGISASEALEDLRECAFGDALAAVCDLDDDAVTRGAGPQLDRISVGVLQRWQGRVQDRFDDLVIELANLDVVFEQIIERQMPA